MMIKIVQWLLLLTFVTQTLQCTMALLSSFLGSPFKYASRRSGRAFATKSVITMMPEGPEVRTVVDQLQGAVGKRLLDIQFLSGRYVRNGKPDGFKEFAATMTPYGRSDTKESVDLIMSWRAKGKFIYIVLDKGDQLTMIESMNEDFQRSIWITLGMTGKFVSEKVHAVDDAHGRWCLKLLDLDSEEWHRIYYHDARNFGTLKFCLSKAELENKLKTLGPDILEYNTTEDAFVKIIKSKSPELNICKFLMNQSNVCGIGNYILAEGLYRAKIDPFALLSELSEDQQRKLFRELRNVALESYSAQGMTRRKGGSYANVDGSKGQFDMQLQCYGQDICPRGSRVIKETNGPHGRTIWYTEEQLFMPQTVRRQLISTCTAGKSLQRNVPLETTKSDQEAFPATDVAAQTSWDTMKEKSGDNTEKLLASLHDPGWKEFALDNVVGTEAFQHLADFLQDECRQGHTLYPPYNEVFSALNLCPLEKVKVVIVGQDPYHGPGQAHGLAFSVRKGVPLPPSLRNIFQEAIEDVNIDAPSNGNLEHWAEQGVLLLNSVLTVRRGQANSHAGKGWEDFTDSIIRYLNANKKGLVFLLFGNPALKKASQVDESRHFLIRTSHPSPLAARKTASPFLGSRCFSRCNEILHEEGKEPVDWNVR